MTSRPPTRPPTSRPGADDSTSGAPPPSSSLDEVERALSLLDGRHHDTVRVQRETQLALEAKRALVEAAGRRADVAERRWAVVRVVLVVLLVGGLAGGGWFATRQYKRTVAADVALAALAAPYLALGFQALPRPLWRPRDHIDTKLPANTCVVALASPSPGGDVGFSIVHSGKTIHATTSAAYCTCMGEHVVVRADADAGGVELLSLAARGLGGNAALPFMTPRPLSLPVAETCATDPLDAWLAAGHGVSPPSRDGLAPSVQTALDSAGFTLVASAPASLPFAVIPGTADSCFVATSTTPGEALALRIVGGERPLQLTAGTALAIAWCSHAAEPVTVSREGTGNIVAYRIGSKVVAGTLGLRELVARAGLGDPPIWVKPTELGWDASAPLVASGVAPADITLGTGARPVANAHAIALTLGSAHVMPEPDEIDRYLCTPALDASPKDALCVQSSPLGWRVKAGEAAGIAEAPLPFWMDVLTRVEDRRGFAVELQLLTLSRHLLAQHYEATAREGVIEEKAGVVVTGRPGDDRIIAIGLMNTAPWVLPYTDDGAWRLDGDPHSIPITAGDELHLVTEPRVDSPPDVRRTVVFRHRAAP